MAHYYLFILTTIIIAVSPGTDTVLVTKNTLLSGTNTGRKTVLGICTGLIIHTIAAVLGLSAIIAKSVFLFQMIKYAGAAYLVYMGITAIFSKKQSLIPDVKALEKEAIKEGRSCFTQGVLSNLLNPKAIIFYFSFIPQFVVPGENVFLQMLTFGFTLVFIVLVWLMVYVYLINHIRLWFNKPSFQRLFQGVTGGILIALGIKLAFEKH